MSSLFVIPVGLAYTEDAERMPFGRERQFMIPDIAVYKKDHTPDEGGISALLDVLDKRIVASLLDTGIARLLSVASGGNIRDLFDLLNRAGLAAEARGAGRIERQDAEESIQELRGNYRFRLGETIYGAASGISLNAKLDKLEAVYRGDPAAQIPDKTLYVLLRQRLVLQYGQVWFGVHPVAVDLLKEQDGRSLKPDGPGGTDLRGD